MQVPMSSVSALPIVGPFAHRLLATDLPSLPTERRNEVVHFIGQRVDIMPSFTRFGVLALGVCFRALLAVPGGWGAARLLMRLPLPFVGEYPRLIRSLSVAYVWEHWPRTAPDGAPA